MRPFHSLAGAGNLLTASGYLLPPLWWAPLGAAVLVSQIFLTWAVFRATGRALLRMIGWLLIADAALVFLLRHCAWEMGRLDYSEHFLVWRQWVVWLGVLLLPAPVAFWTAALHLARPKRQADERPPIMNPAFLAALLMWVASTLLSLAMGTDSSLVPRPARVTRVTVAIPDLPREFDGLRIAVLADLHIGPLLTPERARIALRPLFQERPDMVVVVGDIIGPHPEDLPVAAKVLSEYRAPLGNYAVAGNFDMAAGVDALAEELPRAGVVYLDNDARAVTRGHAELWLAGVGDPWTGHDDLPRTLERVPPEAPVILLAHTLDILPEAQARAIPLVISGHLHGGQIVIPFAGPALGMSRFGARFAWTKGPVGPTFLVVSRGIGYEWVPLRLFCPPEIVLITLRAKQ